MDRATAERTTILRGLVGSTAHGLNVPGTDDRDEMGVCIEDIGDVLRLGQPFEQFIYRSATERTGKQDEPSQAGDLDLTIFSLRKYARLAADGNPTVQILLFVKGDALLSSDSRGGQLQDMAHLFVSREAGKRYLGYMIAQKQRLVGERGQKRIKRPELEEAHGYDTKYAMHMLRLGHQGVELLRTGRLTLPMANPARQFLMDVRYGRIDIQTVLTVAGELERELKDLIDSSPLPAHPDREGIEAWLQRMYLEAWKARDGRTYTPHVGIKRVTQPENGPIHVETDLD